MPDTGAWRYEIKYDGYRMLASTTPAELRTRGGAETTHWFPEIVQALLGLPGGAHIVDGEVCVLDEYGRSDFDQLHGRARRRGLREGNPLADYCDFDLLAYRGRDLRQESIERRKQLLATLTAGMERGILYVSSTDDGASLYQQALALQLEGITAKRAGSRYVGGRSRDWLKIKRPGAIPAGGFHRAIEP